MTQVTENKVPIACDLTAMDAHERDRYEAVREQLDAAVQEVRELSNGYAFRYTADAALVIAAAEFVTLERRCCPFFTFVLEVEAGGGPLWLRLTGGEGVKEFLRSEMGLT